MKEQDIKTATYAGNTLKNLDLQKTLKDFDLAEAWMRKPLSMKKKATQIDPRVYFCPDRCSVGSSPYPPRT
jgi:hypothetical protein